MANSLAQILDFPSPKEWLEPRLLAQELVLARKIQQSLLPRSFPILTGLALAGFCRSAREVSGDFYDALPLGVDGALLAIADVMGKGVPAALFAATLRSFLRTLAPMAQGPAELLARLNRLMFEELSSVDMFITAQVAMINPQRRELTVAGAGHCPLLVSPKTGVAEIISPEGPPLGVLREAVFGEHAVALGAETCALLYTDGLTEARDAQGCLFGQARLADWLSQDTLRHQTVSEAVEDLVTNLHQFQVGATPDDDQSLLLLVPQTRGSAAPTVHHLKPAPAHRADNLSVSDLPLRS